MLLKIFTAQGSLRVIENIEHIEVHPETHYIDGFQACTVGSQEAAGYRDGSLEAASFEQPSNIPVSLPEYYDHTDRLSAPNLLGQPAGFPIKFIDYIQKGSHWKRVAIGFYGKTYLCNDQGRTIQKITSAGCQEYEGQEILQIHPRQNTNIVSSGGQAINPAPTSGRSHLRA